MNIYEALEQCQCSECLIQLGIGGYDKREDYEITNEGHITLMGLNKTFCGKE